MTTFPFAKPRRKKLGTIAARTKGMYLSELDLTQFAHEQIERRLRKLEAAHNANDKELKAAQIQLNLQSITIKRLRERLERRESE